MKNVDVIIVGGGPAGAACAWKLAQHQVDFLVLDKAIFPRVKPCAGWITPLVLRDLEINPAEVIIPLSQHTGSPAIPEVKAGDMVSKGQIIGTVPRGRTGAWIHSSISGRVSKVSEKSVIIEAY